MSDDAALAKATEVLVAGGADTENARRMLTWAAERYDEAKLLGMARTLVLGREWAAKHQ